ncbi:Alpha/Beta hydrolase protein [Fusarium solani]|uniref:Alpha/Beta hydrolase protein n=1 Tax=Fusarium solani TaxID=169388 RepID=A0A9P9KF69_FUSSL|nr:Alpha/Beta hydrolase protein [Fusarium solani]KAH7255056.1 Alpha/Beta hydrolase protein [Fusarium solani]
MDLSKLTQKKLDVSRGFTYTYYTFPAQGSKPTLILFHGWPDTARLWAGSSIISLTSKPTDVASYAYQHMTADITEILDAEKLFTVISVGHDWGSALAQWLYNLHPSRVAGLIMVNVSYIPPSQKFDLNVVNELTRKTYGFGIYDVAFGDPYTWLTNWCSPGGMRKFITEGHTQPTLPYATSEHKEDFMDRFGKPPGFEAPSCWYKAFLVPEQSKADYLLVSEDAKVVNVPAFFWGGEQDFVCRTAAPQPSIDARYLPKVKGVTREGGHWALLEKPAEFGQDVLDWLEETFH